MKKLIFICLLFISCEKEYQTYCWSCNKSTIGPNYTKSLIFDLCGMTPNQIVELEDLNTKEHDGIKESLKCSRKN
jgi:hypothetical protein